MPQFIERTHLASIRKSSFKHEKNIRRSSRSNPLFFVDGLIPYLDAADPWYLEANMLFVI